MNLHVAKPQRVAIYGGTFDPFHKAHHVIVESIIEQFSLSKLIVVPCAEPPHRDVPQTNANHRLAMVKLATKGTAKVEVSDFEITQNGISYSVNTVQFVKAQYPDAELFLCMGEDSLNDFTQWHQWQRILNDAQLLIFPRAMPISTDLKGQGVAPPVSSEAKMIDASRIHFVSGQLMDVSAKKIRARLSALFEKTHEFKTVQQDAQLNHMLAPSVITYILDNQLYL